MKNRFKLSQLILRLNMLNDDINVELLQREAKVEVLLLLEEKLNEVFCCRYRAKRQPILSGSYVDNPMCRATVLYNFEMVD